MATFWEKAARSVSNLFSICILSICNIYLFPALVLRAGFAFCLLQFLFIAFLLLFVILRIYILVYWSYFKATSWITLVLFKSLIFASYILFLEYPKYTPQHNSRTNNYVFPLFNDVSYTFKIKNIFAVLEPFEIISR